MNTELWLKKANEKGLEAFEIFTKSSKDSSLSIYEHKVDNYEISQDGGTGFRAIYDGKMAYFSSQDVADDKIDYILDSLKENAMMIESKEKEMLYDGSKEYQDIVYNHVDEKRVDVTIDWLLKLEKKIYEQDSRIEQVEVMYSCSTGSTDIVNSLGLNLSKTKGNMVLYVSGGAKGKNGPVTSYVYYVINSLDDLNIEDVAKQFKDKVLAKLDPVSINSGEYKVIFKNDCFSNIMQALLSLYNGENAYRKLTPLHDKLDKIIFDAKVTIIDDPFIKEGIVLTNFDDEGYPTKSKNVVENGVLKTFLHSLKSASLMHTDSTGNGFRGYSTPVIISPTNIYMKPGNDSFETLVEKVYDGVLITEVMGLHAGLNPVTTDFSIQCNGFMIEDGKVTKPINLFTVAANYLEMMKNVMGIADDLLFEGSNVGSPSVAFEKLVISGK